MTTFKDPNGLTWRLRVENIRGGGCQDYGERDATIADLLAALGQLSPGSGGPTDEELGALRGGVWHGVWIEGGANVDARVAANRALFNAGLALGEQKQAARVRELGQRVADLKFALGDGAGWFDRCKQAESELAATKAKLAECEQSHAAAVKANEEGSAMLAEVERERDEEIETRCRANLAWQEKHDELSRECGKLRSELASARRHMGLLCDRLRLEVSDHKTPCPCSSCVFVESAEQALRAEAGESGPAKCTRCDGAGSVVDPDDGRPHWCRRCRGTGQVEPTEEPKPEPQPSGFALPWRVEHVRSIRDERGQPVVSSVLDADGKRVASLVTPERATFIVSRCNESAKR